MTTTEGPSTDAPRLRVIRGVRTVVEKEDRSLLSIEVHTEIVPDWLDENGQRVRAGEVWLSVGADELDKPDPLVAVMLPQTAGEYEIALSSLRGLVRALDTSAERLLATLARMGIEPAEE